MKYRVKIQDQIVFANCLDDMTESQKQQMTTDFIRRHIIYLMNSEVEYMLTRSYEDQESPLQFDDIENWDITGYCEFLEEDITEERKEDLLTHYEYLRDKAFDVLERLQDQNIKLGNFGSIENMKREEKIEYFEINTANRLDNYVDELNCLHCEDEPEVFQWFLAPELCYHLKKRGQVVLNNEYWGRQCCGQSIILDRVIQDIAFDIEKDINPDNKVDY